MKIRIGRLAVVIVLAARGVWGVGTAVEKAMGLADQGRITEAITVLDKPADNQGRVLLARLLDYDGRVDEAITVLQAGLKEEIEDLDLLSVLLEIYARRGEDGPTVAYKRGSVTYSPNKDEAAAEAYKQKYVALVVEVSDRALEIAPDADYFMYQKAAALTTLGRETEAVPLFKTLIEAYPEGAALRTELAAVYLNQGKTNAAVVCLEESIEIDPRSVEAYARLSYYFTATGEPVRADRYEQMAAFYEWLPPFVELPFTTNHYATYEIISGAKEVEPGERTKWVDKLIASDEDDAMIFLAALCYHHADHGMLEEKAFTALEEREEAGVPLLLLLFENAQSICTAGQAASALANQKCGLAVEPLIASLSGDVRYIWTYNAAENLARIGDPRAVSELILLADVETDLSEAEDDPMNGFEGRMAARYRAAFALGAFRSERAEVESVLAAGTENPQMALVCYAGLFRLTGDEKHRTAMSAELEKNDKGLFWLKSALDASADPCAKALTEKLPE